MPSGIFMDNIYQLGRQTQAEVKFSLVAPEAKEVATVAFPTQTVFSRGEQVIDNISGVGAPIATFEPNLWRLDGTFVLPLMPVESNMQVGFWSSQRSDGDGNLNPNLVIDITFDLIQSIRRFGVAFDEASNNFCTHMKVIAYDSSNNVILDEEVFSDTAYANTLGGATGVKSCKFIFISTNNPYRHLRVSEIDFGVIVTFTNTDIINLSLTTEGEITGRRFPYSQLTLRVANEDRFNILDPESYAQFLYTRQPFEYRHGLVLPDGSTEWVYMGAYYLQDKQISDDAVNFTCYGKTSILDNFIFTGSSLQELTIGNVIDLVLKDINFDYYVSSELYQTPVVTAYLGTVDYRTALVMLADMSTSLAFENQDNTIVFKNILDGQLSTDNLTYDNIIRQPQLRQSAYYNGITLAEYEKMTEVGQLANVQLAVSGSRQVQIFFDGPQQGGTSYTITSGFTLTNVQYSLMYMTATLTGNGTATIVVSGQRITFIRTETFYNAPWRDPYEPDYPFLIDLPMMIRTPNFEIFRSWFLQRKFKLLQKRLTSEIYWLGNFAVQLGDTATLQINRKGDTLDMSVVKSITTFNGGALRGNLSLVSDNP